MSATDPWADEWAAMSYAARLSWWWSARGAHQSQEDWAAGKEAPAGVSCKYGIPGTWPGSRIPYSKEPTVQESKAEESKQEESTKEEESKQEESTKAEESKQEESTKVEETKQEESTTEEESKAEEPLMKKEETRPIIKLTIPASTTAIHVSKNKKKQKNKH
jgi:hypothetical protein